MIRFAIPYNESMSMTNTEKCMVAGICLLLATSLAAPYSALADYSSDSTVHETFPATYRNNSSNELNGWVNENDLDARRWYDQGTMARSKEFYDPGSQSWYWADADGSIAHDKDVFQSSNGGKWVRYDYQGQMIKGEDYRYGSWYFFDLTTGAMAKGTHHIGSNGGKWVYYDWVTGKMVHGEHYINYDATHTGWYLFDNHTGAMFHGDTFIRSNDGKWVRYDRVSGKMVHGLQYQDGSYYYFDQDTGKMAHGATYVPDWHGIFWFDENTGRFEGIYYPNCAAVRKAGKAPLHSGDPGYRSGLDRDHDGIACE